MYMRADLKATALLKLIYLEMMGHDMSWASFHVLEVMSSSKHQQKRIGYLGAVQSFRPDTEVLMLATNLIKKVCRTSPRGPGNQAADVETSRISPPPRRPRFTSRLPPYHISLRPHSPFRHYPTSCRDSPPATHPYGRKR